MGDLLELPARKIINALAFLRNLIIFILAEVDQQGIKKAFHALLNPRAQNLRQLLAIKQQIYSLRLTGISKQLYLELAITEPG